MAYSAKDIVVLKGLDGIRERPTMYIGSTELVGISHCLLEIITNSVDEAAAGYGSKIIVTIHKDNSITVQDHGRGIPVDIHPEVGLPAVRVILETPHAGGKMKGNKNYKAAGGLNGVGATALMALSVLYEVTIERDGKRYFLSYSKGKLVKDLEVVGSSNDTGTTIHYKLDDSIFTNEGVPSIELPYQKRGRF